MARLSRRRTPGPLGGAHDAPTRALDGAPEPVVGVDSTGSVTGWNRAAERFFGWRRGQALGRPLWQLVLPERDHRRSQEVLARRLAAGPTDALDGHHMVTVVDRDGRERVVEALVWGVGTAEGTRFTAIVHDPGPRRAQARLDQETLAVAAVARATRRLREGADAGAVRQSVCQAATELTGAALAFVAEPPPGRPGDARRAGRLVVSAVVGPALHELAHRLVPHEAPAAALAVHEGGAPLVVEDLARCPAGAAALVATGGARGLYLQPVRRDTAPVAVLGLAWGTPMRAPSAQLRRVAELLAEEAASALALSDRISALEASASSGTSWDGQESPEALLERAARALERGGRPTPITRLPVPADAGSAGTPAR